MQKQFSIAYCFLLNAFDLKRSMCHVSCGIDQRRKCCKSGRGERWYCLLDGNSVYFSRCDWVLYLPNEKEKGLNKQDQFNFDYCSQNFTLFKSVNRNIYSSIYFDKSNNSLICQLNFLKLNFSHISVYKNAGHGRIIF